MMRSSSFSSSPHGPILVVAAAAAALLSSEAEAQTTIPVNASKKPNILFLMADQHRHDALGFSTRGRIQTPNLDKIGSEGVIMKSSWSSTPICTPARAALVSGQNGWNNGAIGYTFEVPVNISWVYPQALVNVGYHTAALGKNHFGWSEGKGIPHGFQETNIYDGLGYCEKKHRHDCHKDTWDSEFDNYDEWFTNATNGEDPQKTLDSVDGAGWNTWHAKPYVYEEYYHPTAWVTRNAVSWIKKYDKPGTPFMFKVSYHRPHSPYDPPQRVLDTVTVDDLPELFQGGNWDAKYKIDDADNADACFGDFPIAKVNFSRAYYANIQFVDEGVGQVVEAVKEKGIYEDTWILYTSDHGDGQQDHFHWRKGYPYEFATHVPMIIRWPANFEPEGLALQRGSTLERVVELRDVAHTFAEIGGAVDTIPAGRFKKYDGQSLLCLFRDPTGTQSCDYAPNPGPWREYIDLELAEVCGVKWHFWNAMTDGTMKYIYWPHFETGSPLEQLFNLTADPGEMIDLVQGGGEAVKAQLTVWRKRMGDMFLYQKRGDGYVYTNGTLVPRTKSSITSPSYGHD